MSPYAWIIYFDHVENRRVEVVGPSDVNPDLVIALKRSGGEPFELYDDDGNLYFSGAILGDYSGFEPLDDYGMPAAGCTQVKLNGEWL